MDKPWWKTDEEEFRRNWRWLRIGPPMNRAARQLTSYHNRKLAAIRRMRKRRANTPRIPGKVGI